MTKHTAKTTTLALSFAAFGLGSGFAGSAGAQPSGEQNATAIVQKAEAPALNWFGFGVRYGTAKWSFKADALRDALRENSDGQRRERPPM